MPGIFPKFLCIQKQHHLPLRFLLVRLAQEPCNDLDRSQTARDAQSDEHLAVGLKFIMESYEYFQDLKIL